MIPHNWQRYDLWVDAVNSIASVAEQHGGILPLPDGVHRDWGEAFLIRTGPTSITNNPIDWTTWFVGTTNRNVRNFYYFGHGNPDSIGDGWGGMPSHLWGFLLGNSITKPVGQTRYRFVWMDGCETANGTWPYAFAMGKQENKQLSSYATRPGAFCGFTQRPTIGFHDGMGNGSMLESACFYRSQFAFYWHFQNEGVKEAFRKARDSSGWTEGDGIKVYGYWGLRVSEFNRKSQWP